MHAYRNGTLANSFPIIFRFLALHPLSLLLGSLALSPNLSPPQSLSLCSSLSLYPFPPLSRSLSFSLPLSLSLFLSLFRLLLLSLCLSSSLTLSACVSLSHKLFGGVYRYDLIDRYWYCLSITMLIDTTLYFGEKNWHDVKRFKLFYYSFLAEITS